MPKAIAEMCERHGVSFIFDGITSVGGMPVHPAKWKAEAVVMGAQKCTAGPSGIAAIAVNELRGSASKPFTSKAMPILATTST